MKRPGIWRRLLYIILFAVIYGVVEIILAAIVVLQFGFMLFTEKPNEHLLTFGRTLSRFFYDVLLFLTFNSDDRPFPFSPWPSAEATVSDTIRPKQDDSKHSA